MAALLLRPVAFAGAKPTIRLLLADSKISGTTASGSFISAMTNLEENTTYYVRAFATNSVGTGYGNVVTFTTTTDPNSVTFTYNGATVTYGVITSAVTGRKWMDRNLGASRVATASNDRMAYGHLFQWGRPADGHQLVNYTNSTTGAGVNGKTKTLATSDVPGNSTFITPDNTVEQNGVFVYDWRNDQNTNRWAINSQGSCPSGWHVPTMAEWEAETGITNLTTGFNQLKLTAAGYRYGDFDGSGREGTVRTAGSSAWYWSSSVWPSGTGFSSYQKYSIQRKHYGPGRQSLWNAHSLYKKLMVERKEILRRCLSFILTKNTNSGEPKNK